MSGVPACAGRRRISRNPGPMARRQIQLGGDCFQIKIKPVLPPVFLPVRDQEGDAENTVIIYLLAGFRLGGLDRVGRFQRGGVRQVKAQPGGDAGEHVMPVEILPFAPARLRGRAGKIKSLVRQIGKVKGEIGQA